MRTLSEWQRVSYAYALFGKCAIVAFIAMQVLDGLFTYMAVQKFGIEAEWNPILLQWMSWVGYPAALLGAKLIATALGILLHLMQAHLTVAYLSLLYVGVAVWPWLKFFS